MHQHNPVLPTISRLFDVLKSAIAPRGQRRRVRAAVGGESLESRQLLTASFGFDYGTIASDLSPTLRFFGSPNSSDAPFTILRYGEGQVTSLHELGLGYLDPADVTFQFGSSNPAVPVEVVTLSSFDDGVIDGLANQIYTPDSDDQPLLTIFRAGVPVAEGRVQQIALETTPLQQVTSARSTFLLDRAIGGDTRIYDELVAASQGTNVVPFNLTAFNLEGPWAGVGDAQIFRSTGTSLFPAITPPVITGPPGVTPFQRPTITWNSVPGANRYEVWVKNASTGVNPYIDTVRTSTAFYPQSDLGIGTYNLWIRALTPTGQTSDYSPQYNFRINTAAVFASLPAVQTTATPTLSWQPLAGATKYDVWIDSLPTGPSQIVRNANVTGTSLTVASALPMGSYRAWVRGIDASGRAAAWSVPITFQVLLPVTVPSPATSTFDRTPTLSWNAVPGAFRYVVFLRNANTGVLVSTSPVPTGTSFTPSADLPDGSYRWQVVAVAKSGDKSQSATTQELFIGGRPALSTPIGTTSDTTPEFSWTAVQGAASYQLFVSRIDVPTGGIINLTGLTATSYTPATPLPIGTYRAWVRAVSATSELSPYSLQVNFTITGGT